MASATEDATVLSGDASDEAPEHLREFSTGTFLAYGPTWPFEGLRGDMVICFMGMSKTEWPGEEVVYKGDWAQLTLPKKTTVPVLVHGHIRIMQVHRNSIWLCVHFCVFVAGMAEVRPNKESAQQLPVPQLGGTREQRAGARAVPKSQPGAW
jgi:hypothetical protein